jgi:hypothetical protein
MNMIRQTDAMEVFQKNIDRTNSLIAAMEKIGAYNRIYQMKAAEVDSGYARIVTQIQDEELRRIEKSCSEHAIISLATPFETFYKELLQELLYCHANFFLTRNTKYTDKLAILIKQQEQFSYEQIEVQLKLQRRFDYYSFFEAYSVPLLEANEAGFIEYLYIKRNNLVHNAGKLDEKTLGRLKNTPSPVNEISIVTESKRLRTKFTKLIKIVNRRTKEAISQE